ncbi:glycosyltransferase family 4 protein [Peterkaempfera sp. SMS 1(5)a]|uniref:glycosyltransferase family 4 protein n=1 Tax=Peterkaempfera podocarpi TaxID=3232308 RepID=UPI003672ED93
MSDTASAHRPRVLHLVTDARRRGAQNLARDLHGELLARGWDSRLAALQPHPDAPSGDPLPVLGATRFHPATLRSLRRTAATADVVVAHGSSTLPACAAALLGSRTPFIYVSIGDPRHWTADRSRRLRVGAMLRRAAAVAALTDGARKVLLERFRLRPERVRTIPNGRPADRYPPAADPAQRSAARSALGLPAEVALVAAVGALAPEKRLDLAVEAVTRTPGAHLAVAGEGPLRSALTEHADTLAPGRVHFLGGLPDPAPLYQAADALLLSSDSEGVPGVLIEAALAALPSVATDVGWVREVVLDGVTGVLAPPGDAQALADGLGKVLGGDRAALGAEARRRALDRFELGVVVDAWQQLLAEVAAVR